MIVGEVLQDEMGGLRDMEGKQVRPLETASSAGT